MESKDLDMEYDDGDYDVPQTKNVVAAEKDLEGTLPIDNCLAVLTRTRHAVAKSQLSLIHTIQIYSLSPAIIRVRLQIDIYFAC